MTTLPTYIDLLPGNFKVVRDTSSSLELEKHELNPVLLTAFLLDELQGNVYTKTIADFNREFRIPDTLLDTSIAYNPEIYKGFLAFKSTKHDLLYYLRQSGITLAVEDLAPSGLLDSSDRILIDGSWLIDEGNLLIAAKIDDSQYIDRACEIGVTVVITITDSVSVYNDVSKLYNSISKLLYNRLSAITILGVITFKIDIVNSLDIDIIENTGYVFTLSQVSESAYSDTVINNAEPTLINPSGSVIGDYRLSEVYKVT